MEDLVYFGAYWESPTAAGFELEDEGKFVPLAGYHSGKEIWMELLTGEVIRGSSLKVETEWGRERVWGSKWLFHKLQTDFERSEKLKSLPQGRRVVFGSLHTEEPGKMAFKSGDAHIPLTFMVQGGKKYLRLQNGALQDASSVEFRVNADGKSYSVVGSERLYYLLWYDYADAVEWSNIREGEPEVRYGSFHDWNGGKYLKIGDALVKLDIREDEDGEEWLRLNDGTARLMENVHHVADAEGKEYLVGPLSILHAVLDDFDRAVRKDRQAVALRRRPAKNTVERADTAEFTVEESKRGTVPVAGQKSSSSGTSNAGERGIGGLPRETRPPERRKSARQGVTVTAEYGDTHRAKKAGKPVRALGRLKAAAYSVVLAFVLLVTGLVSGNLSPPGCATGGQKAGTEQVRVEEQKQDYGKILSDTVKVDAPKPAETVVAADTLDLSLKENREIARSSGFGGIAKKMHPELSGSQLYKFADEIAKQNLKEGHKDINNWKAGDLKTPGKIIVEKQVTPRMSVVNVR